MPAFQNINMRNYTFPNMTAAEYLVGTVADLWLFLSGDCCGVVVRVVG